ncbi:MAG: hypothetical protein M0P91_04380 [Sulfuricurvum sp.]|jgi:hypothetical protein|uniref:hypothetical protein n=1 Tax=Sulfuricurvum sp. TaxID=2025608 RepID=UPI0025FBBCDE|nr:hypothetical protein [Sulfuricurvum sp.]MCK9372411.1 hypothetical protein [Sulfuricurvum sp.]
MQRIAYWLFPLIAVAVAIFIIVFMIQINSAPPSAKGEPSSSGEERGTPVKEGEAGWLERFSSEEDKSHLYPLNELTLELDTLSAQGEEVSFRLSVPLKNDYELFCLKQELKKRDFPYFLQKEGDDMTLLVDSNNQSELESLVTKLKTYQIMATVSPLIEEK